MRIAGTQYSIKNRSLEIYLSGCKAPHCEGCHNEELHSFDEGRPWRDVWELLADKIYKSRTLIKHIFVVGGEPLDQDHEQLVEFTSMLCSYARRLDMETWLFTRYELEEVKPYFKMQYDFIKTGPYIKGSEKHTQYGLELSSENQKVNARSIDYYCESTDKPKGIGGKGIDS